eukprot:CAMPEP_0197575030 /NCGR_PEP_ID=MMETSP1326-20131121/574_1 /TAXON_ID=1155430 /ORGANISM="Genus nov. species nov., Strain RCC2288" /LENGTH=105 /DNA_ID=CAMNT_0043137725 /DNA_START=117 /DNA_END=434 /DNA_ORIENTATION=+
MAYNLYQVQMAKAWTERVNKEAAMAEKFWFDRSKGGDTASMVGSEFPGSQVSRATTYKSATTEVLKGRLEALESQLALERTARLKVEADLAALKPGQATLSSLTK